ncbi:hypothetical protein AVEN_34197-1 [Araneus ventricosus]|uniref:Uncharacterized protein n=1 Tax=Araneus ventricosus TaxID=182803 RepID=A0A4Y2GGR3_ARAVE|nr:hypothetical protein AVEN_34197-1 [Araneus ventricosus]
MVPVVMSTRGVYLYDVLLTSVMVLEEFATTSPQMSAAQGAQVLLEQGVILNPVWMSRTNLSLDSLEAAGMMAAVVWHHNLGIPGSGWSSRRHCNYTNKTERKETQQKSDYKVLIKEKVHDIEFQHRVPGFQVFHTCCR